ncbi:putative toxin-antitoxin system toxin component, PIN family [Magnetospirillum sulfuroxidans]|jgi:putative PIN family toxin of toxin-antitoxin system|uniref:Toxin-antitoxin system toxin component, PIN family n=1 Tax=Magnetospirillum sulfuroxidans TaxID=611300 RepID=A0ABS5I8W3_9PROT|nr:putative toxin-antitoxin system toxin component, PIN family [Magnetospirillum sulfuroxidans]MBR9970877.1 putative toxin-antitoxin system toxin component, PIN family [Magnetospirillum sulfuroxidans]
MRVLIDCNILVSAAISGGVCLRAIAEARDNHTILISEEILDEYRRVAGYRKFSEGIRMRMHALIEEVALRADYLTIPANPPQTEEIGDADDLVYVIAAHVGNADAIVTGNTAHFTAPTYGNALVVTAREFLDMVGG